MADRVQAVGIHPKLKEERRGRRKIRKLSAYFRKFMQVVEALENILVFSFSWTVYNFCMKSTVHNMKKNKKAASSTLKRPFRKGLRGLRLPGYDINVRIANAGQPMAMGSMHASLDEIKDIFREMTQDNIDNRINRMSDY